MTDVFGQSPCSLEATATHDAPIDYGIHKFCDIFQVCVNRWFESCRARQNLGTKQPPWNCCHGIIFLSASLIIMFESANNCPFPGGTEVTHQEERDILTMMGTVIVPRASRTISELKGRTIVSGISSVQTATNMTTLTIVIISVVDHWHRDISILDGVAIRISKMWLVAKATIATDARVLRTGSPLIKLPPHITKSATANRARDAEMPILTRYL